MPIDLTTRYDRYGRPREGSSATLGVNEMPAREGDLTADRELCLDADGKPCEVKDPAKRTLLVAPGQVIPRERVAELGLRFADGRVEWGPEKGAARVAKQAAGKK